MKHNTLLGIIIIMLTIAGCGDAGKTNDGDFFPLNQDITWEYDVVVFDGSGNIMERRDGTVSNLAKVELANNIVTPQKYHTEASNAQHQVTQTSSTEFISQDKDGIFRLATQKENEVPAVGMRLYYILKPIKVGATKEYTYADTYQSITIDSINDIVNVQAGTFKDCLKVSFTAKDKFGTYQNTSWYAPNIGRIKRIVIFPNQNKMVSQLKSYKK
jgi:hypothetical protein